MYPRVRCAPIKEANNTLTASPAARSRVLSRHRASVLMLQGRHMNAAAAPISNPPERVSVERYTKLVRSRPENNPKTPSMRVGAERFTHHINNHDASTPPMSSRNRVDWETDQPSSATHTSGHTTYHCSSTARLHRCRSIGGSPAEKYGMSPTICPQFAA